MILLFISILLCGWSANALWYDGWTTTEKSQYYIEQWKHMVGHDTLIDIYSRTNKSDKNRWYFKSPLITMKPRLMSFTLRGLMGNYNKLNAPLNPVKIGDHVFSHITFNGFMSHYYVQFIPHLWNPPINVSQPFYVEILGDWTQENETVVLSDVRFYS